MKRKIEIAMALFCIFAAFYNFDFYNTNQQIVSGLLFLTGILTLSKNEKFNRILRALNVGLAIWLMIRILLYGT